ncbi:hypothetical protein GCM10023310_32290 [Paenibacillus vulneris]|uniref:Uncharacterized protein n=1 Tax=Paenibacillus vulneris TaxID=1133364 RepID=A0ABW3UR77_9BACL|nr:MULTISPECIES: hypothetical protein [unclassified Paenibacillus]MBE1442782.1 hypothetical protein [Paenibacillus sp. OAS669]
MKRTKLYKGFRELTSEIHLYTAANDRTPIIVFRGDELVGSGVIKEITELSVKIRDERYMRAACRFVYVR